MKKIPRYTGISQYLRYHNLHSIIQWNVHYSRTLQTNTTQRKLDENSRIAGKNLVYTLQYLLKILRMPVHNSPIRAISGGTGLNYHSCGSFNISRCISTYILILWPKHAWACHYYPHTYINRHILYT